MRNRKQCGQVIRISDMWHVRYWEKRNINGNIERKRVTHALGPVTTKGKKPPPDVVIDAEKHMMAVNSDVVSPEHTVTLRDFVENVYLPWVELHNRPSTASGYRDIWDSHLQQFGNVWFKNVRTYHAQQWLNTIAKTGLSKSTLKRIKSFISAVFKLAKQQGYFHGENPARDTAINPHAASPEEMYAYTLEDVLGILAHLPEPAGTIFAVAAFTGLRHGEIQGLVWENYHDGAIQVSTSIWRGKVTPPKSRKSNAAVPVIKQLADRLELHRLRSGSPKTGPIFRTGKKTPKGEYTPLSLNNVLGRDILPALKRCEKCSKSQYDHDGADHEFKRDASIPEWRGWHAGRRGLGSNLYRLGVPELVIQRILRHANVSTTTGYYIKTIADDVKDAMQKLENAVPKSLTDTYRTLTN